LSDSNPEILNKKLILSKKHFNQPILLFYEKHKIINNKKIVEYYTNDILENYFETTIYNQFKITKGYSKDRVLFSIEKIEYDVNREPIYAKSWIRINDGTILYTKQIGDDVFRY